MVLLTLIPSRSVLLGNFVRVRSGLFVEICRIKDNHTKCHNYISRKLDARIFDAMHCR